MSIFCLVRSTRNLFLSRNFSITLSKIESCFVKKLKIVQHEPVKFWGRWGCLTIHVLMISTSSLIWVSVTLYSFLTCSFSSSVTTNSFSILNCYSERKNVYFATSTDADRRVTCTNVQSFIISIKIYYSLLVNKIRKKQVKLYYSHVNLINGRVLEGIFYLLE